jgi:hypothetical protein
MAIHSARGVTSNGANSSLAIRIGLALLFFAFAAESLVFATHSRTLIDEGVFLAAARLVYQGELLYRDFPSSQGPTLPYVYGLFLHVFGSSIAVGRAVSWIGCLVTAGAACWIARRFGGRLAAALTLAMTMLNLPALWVGTTVRTQSLSTPLTLLAVAALAVPARTALGWAAAPSLLLWSTSTRLTNGLALVAVCLWVAWQLRHSPALLLRVAAILAAQAALAFAPLLFDLRASFFHVVTAQLSRGAPGAHLPSQLDFFFDPVLRFLPSILLGIALALILDFRAWRRARIDLSLPLRNPFGAQIALVALAGLVFAPHLALNRPFLTYFVTSSMLLTPAIGIALARAAETRAPRAFAVWAAIGVVLAALLGNAAASWGTFLGGERTSFAHFREVGRELRELAGPSCTMVTFQTHLAVEAGCRVLPGLEYSHFSYFRDMSDEEAAARSVLNLTILDRRIATLRPELVAVSRQDARMFRERGPPPQVGGRIPALSFLPSAQADYALYGSFDIASGLRRDRRLPDAVQILVFARRDLLLDAGAVSPTRSRSKR